MHESGNIYVCTCRYILKGKDEKGIVGYSRVVHMNSPVHKNVNSVDSGDMYACIYKIL